AGGGTGAVTATVTHDNSGVSAFCPFTAVQGGDQGAEGPKGDAGAAGPRTVTGLVYYQITSANQPATPSASAFVFDDGVFVGISSNWGVQPPTFQAGNTNKYWYSYYTVVEDEFGGSQTITFTEPLQGIGFSGLVTFQGDADTISDGTNTMSFGASGTTTI